MVKIIKSKRDTACVIVTSYNHQNYIKESLESILIQKTNFHFKVFLADDCSTDKTRQIQKDFIKKYPKIFFSMYTPKNIGLVKNMENAFKKTDSDYIFMLEGDDFWTSPNKMQQQVDFLENNKFCPMIANRIWIKDEINNTNYSNGNINNNDVVKSNNIYFLTTPFIINNQIAVNFSSFAFRKSSLENLGNKIYKERLWDWFFSLLMSTQGPVAYMNEPMSVYRIVSTGQWSRKSDKERIMDMINIIPSYNRALKYIYDKEFKIMEYSLKKQLNNKLIPNSNQKLLESLLPPKLYQLLKNIKYNLIK